jgi:hypothetical protein
MDTLHQTIDHCWKQRDVVIMDGFRCTNKLVRWVEEHPLKPAALFVYIELSLNNNLKRLRGRRESNGKIEAKLPTKTFLNVLSFRERALGVWNYAQEVLVVVHDWEKTSTSKWPLSYRGDKRNWRLSNQQAYRASCRVEEL